MSDYSKSIHIFKKKIRITEGIFYGYLNKTVNHAYCWYSSQMFPVSSNMIGFSLDENIRIGAWQTSS